MSSMRDFCMSEGNRKGKTDVDREHAPSPDQMEFLSSYRPIKHKDGP
jgi:hypothetical protein